MTKRKDNPDTDGEEWEAYDGYHNAEPAGDYVRIVPDGSIYLSRDVTAKIPADCRRLRIYRNLADTQLRIEFCRQGLAGSIVLSGPRGGRRGVRASTRSAIKHRWGLAPAVRTQYPAAWRDGRLYIDLTAGVPCPWGGSRAAGEPAVRRCKGRRRPCPECGRLVGFWMDGARQWPLPHDDPDGVPCKAARPMPAKNGT